MADEIALNLGLTVRKGADPNMFRVDVPSHILTRNLTGNRRCSNTQNIGTTEEALVVGDLGSAGYGWFKNLDPTNYIQLGIVVSATFYPFSRLNPGDEAEFPLDTLNLYAKAHTGACNLDYTILEV